MKRALQNFERHAFSAIFACFCHGAFFSHAGSAVAASKVAAFNSQIVLPTYPWAPVRHPYFRGTDKVNIYPYPMLDFLLREKTNRTYRAVVLENDYLRLTILPELGGKIHEVLDKTTGQPMFYVNHVVKPGLIGQCGAWTSGGVEWNTGPQGHTVSCMQPVDVEILPTEPDGSQSVAIGETERIYGTKWTVVVTLRPGRSFIEERIRIYNPTETIRPYYFWNCTAAPNTPGFRFVYPMTLGMDHSGEKFFHWPIHDGKDLSYGRNYQDASSIFAYYCDQDFFGSYNDDLDRGVVSFANHHEVPGKKAWTWGRGNFGAMHQMDLTDNDGPYNEVQTGPLLTQGEVGRLDPCEAVEWKEWWYPIHSILGLAFASKDVAVNVSWQNGELRLRCLGTGTWEDAKVILSKEGRTIQTSRCKLNPRNPAQLRMATPGRTPPFDLEIRTTARALASFRFPLDLPLRNEPQNKLAPHTASEFVQAGWNDFLFARFTEAENHFQQALKLDASNPQAQTGLAYVKLDPDPAAAAAAAHAALNVEPGEGRARYCLAVAQDRLGQQSAALDDAWQAALDPGVAVAARALIAKLLFRQNDYSGAINELSASGPWRTDPLCRNRLALAALKRHELRATATRPATPEIGDLLWAGALAEENLGVDPLDPVAADIRFRANPSLTRRPAQWAGASQVHRQQLAELAAEYSELGNPFAPPEAARLALTEEPWPWRLETLPTLRQTLATNPQDPQTALRLGHLLFHLRRYTEARELWKRATQSGPNNVTVVACRALGMAAKTIDHDLKEARAWLEKANQVDPSDSILARDLARVLVEIADKSSGEAEQRSLITQARDALKPALGEGKGRSDFVALLAKTQNRLGDYSETAQLLDSVRVTVWEGAHEVHDLFEQAHLALGESQLKAGQADKALAEFDRALEYPQNLATGKLENAHEAHIHYLRGNALAALGRLTEARAAWQGAADEPESKEPRIEKARQAAKECLKSSRN